MKYTHFTASGAALGDVLNLGVDDGTDGALTAAVRGTRFVEARALVEQKLQLGAAAPGAAARVASVDMRLSSFASSTGASPVGKRLNSLAAGADAAPLDMRLTSLVTDTPEVAVARKLDFEVEAEADAEVDAESDDVPALGSPMSSRTGSRAHHSTSLHTVDLQSDTSSSGEADPDASSASESLETVLVESYVRANAEPNEDTGLAYVPLACMRCAYYVEPRTGRFASGATEETTRSGSGAGADASAAWLESILEPRDDNARLGPSNAEPNADSLLAHVGRGSGSTAPRRSDAVRNVASSMASWLRKKPSTALRRRGAGAEA